MDGSVDEHGWFAGARRIESPNQDPRPPGAEVEVLIVHAISLPEGVYGGDAVERLFTNRLPAGERPEYAGLRDLRVSAHFFVRRDGELIQFVSCRARAWHAGVSLCEGRARVNDFSVGIELEGTDHGPFEDRQYETLVGLSRALMRRYPRVRAERLYGHSDIAPGRKTDPGPYFDWSRYRRALMHEASPPKAGEDAL